MKRYATPGKLVFFGILLIGGIFGIREVTREEVPEWITGTVTKGVVQEVVSVSGTITAKSESDLSFPTNGIVREILVKEGDFVTKGQILATLEQSELLADRQDAYAALRIAQADTSELITGPRDEERDVTTAAVAIAKEDLERTKTEEARKVENAYRTLLSEDLEALPLNRNTTATPPTISGTYTCEAGTYTLEMFRSGAQSGFSYRLDGIDKGTYPAYIETPAPFGTCGLSIQFGAGTSYGNVTWEITIPNTRGDSYTTNLNTYTLALQQEQNAVAAAEQAYIKATREQTLENAQPRDEALTRAHAMIAQAEARLAAIDARISNRTLTAPFDGIISDIPVTVGEISTDNVMTIVASNVFVLKVRVPEIDITKIKVNQPAITRFDARPEETVGATVGYVSEAATEIDGVAYFEAELTFENPPEWFRSGLNADVNIIVDERTDVLRVPKRFLVSNGDTHHLLYPNDTTTRTQPVEVLFTGNDGYIAITGDVREGDTIIAP
jgi:HlyD family secretion protein